MVNKFKKYLISLLFVTSSFSFLKHVVAVEYKNPPAINLIGDSFMNGWAEATRGIYGAKVNNFTNGGVTSFNIFNDFGNSTAQWTKYGKNVSKNELFMMYFWGDQLIAGDIELMISPNGPGVAPTDYLTFDAQYDVIKSQIIDPKLSLIQKVTDAEGFVVVVLNQLSGDIDQGDLVRYFEVDPTQYRAYINSSHDFNQDLILAVNNDVKNFDRVIFMNGLAYEKELSNKGGFSFAHFRAGSPNDNGARDNHLNDFQAKIRADYGYNTLFAPVVLSSIRDIAQDQIQVNEDRLYSRMINSANNGSKNEGFIAYVDLGGNYKNDYRFDKISSGFSNSGSYNFAFNMGVEYKFGNGSLAGIGFSRDNDDNEYKLNSSSISHTEGSETISYDSINKYKIGIRDLSASLYAIYSIDDFYFTGVFSLGTLKYNFERSIGKIKDFLINLRGETDGYQTSAMFGGGYNIYFAEIFKFNTGIFFDGSNVSMKNFKETGNVANAVVKYQIPDLTSVSGKLKAELSCDKKFENSSFVLSPTFGVEYEKKFGNSKPVKFKIDNITNNHFSLPPFPSKQNKNLFSGYVTLSLKMENIVGISLSYKEKAFNVKDKHQRQFVALVNLSI